MPKSGIGNGLRSGSHIRNEPPEPGASGTPFPIAGLNPGRWMLPQLSIGNQPPLAERSLLAWGTQSPLLSSIGSFAKLLASPRFVHREDPGNVRIVIILARIEIGE